jgi:hypothetical protein
MLAFLYCSSESAPKKLNYFLLLPLVPELRNEAELNALFFFVPSTEPVKLPLSTLCFKSSLPM